MFDTLTSDELFALHSSLFSQATRIHRRMISEDGYPSITVCGDEWRILAAWHADIGDMQMEVGAELRRRAQEALDYA